MYEVEAKVRLSLSEYKRLKSEISKFADKAVEVRNIDRYYPFNKDFAFRVRKRNNKDYLHLKSKKREKGMEINQEIELEINSADKMIRFLKSIDIELPLKKEKKSEIFKYTNFQIELNHIKTLGYFLEIESVVKSKANISNVKRNLKILFNRLGYTEKDFENKTYLELLAERSRINPS